MVVTLSTAAPPAGTDAIASVAATSHTPLPRPLLLSERFQPFNALDDTGKASGAAGFAGLITKEKRPRKGGKSLTNIIRVVSREWSAWLKRGGRQPKHRQGVKVDTLRIDQEISAVEDCGNHRAAARLRTCPGGS